MTRYAALPDAYQPHAVTVELPGDAAYIDAAAAELRQGAEQDAHNCWGYFPGMRGNATIASDLPACEQFAGVVPTIMLDGKVLKFNFLRMSLVQQRGDAPFHLDTDAATALTGDTSTLSSRLVWRLLINMSDRHSRTLGYLDVDPRAVELRNEGGYIHCEDRALSEERAQRVVLPPRQGRVAHAVLFCASRVLHTGQDDEHGHFVSGFGCEEPDPEAH